MNSQCHPVPRARKRARVQLCFLFLPLASLCLLMFAALLACSLASFLGFSLIHITKASSEGAQRKLLFTKYCEAKDWKVQWTNWFFQSKGGASHPLLLILSSTIPSLAKEFIFHLKDWNVCNRNWNGHDITNIMPSWSFLCRTPWPISIINYLSGTTKQLNKSWIICHVLHPGR